MNSNGPFSTMQDTTWMKKGMRCLFLSTCFILTYFCALAQTVKPNWVDDLGGASGTCVTTGLAIDKQNNIYIAGYFSGTVDFDPSAGVKNLTSAGASNIFVAKYTSAGALTWAETMAGNGSDVPNGIAVDNAGNVSIVGQFTSSILNANPGPGVYNLNNPSTNAIFIIHLNTGGGFLWAYSYEGPGGPGLPGVVEDSYKVTTDSQDNVITTTTFSAPLTVGDSTYTVELNSSGLIVKYSPAGNVVWNVVLQDAEEENAGAYGASVDSQDNIIVSGTFTSSVNFNPLGAAYNLTATNSGASFVAKYSSSGALVWANAINSTAANVSLQSAVSIDSQNNVYFSTPYQQSAVFGSVTLTGTGSNPNVSIAKYSSAGALQFAKSIGGQGSIGYNNSLANDAGNNIYLTGDFSGTVNFNPNTGTAENLTSHGASDFYLAKYDSNGNYLYAFNGGSANCANTAGNSLAIDANDNVDVAGEFCSTVNFGVSGCSSDNLTAVNNPDGFIAQYSVDSSAIIANNIITAPAVSSFCGSGTPGVITGSLPTGGSGTYTYQWQSSTDSVTFVNISGATAQTYTPSTLTATTYFQRTVSSGGCTTPLASNLVALTITSAPAAPAVPGASTCAGSTSTLSVTLPQQGLTYNWYTSAASDTLLYTGVSFTTPALTAATTYYVTAVNSTGCVSATPTAATVTIMPSAVIANNVLTAPAVSSFCSSGTPGAITGSLPTGGSGTYTYQWQSSADSVNFADISGATAQNYTPSTLTATTYFQRTVSSGVCATPLTSNVIDVTIATTPAAPDVPGVTSCTGSAAILSVSSPVQGITYNWYASATSDTLLFAGTSFTTPVLIASVTYYVAATNSTGCIAATRTAATVTFSPVLATPVVTAGPTTASSVTFEWTAVPGATGYQVSTDNGQTYSAPTSGATGLTDTVGGLQAGQSVTIYVFATGNVACQVSTGSAAVTGTAISSTDDVIYVPNAFTPNGDGINDQVHVHSENIKTLNFNIFDQWGELLFTSNSIQNGWNGTYKGAKEPVGVYVYSLQAEMNDGDIINLKGTITLLK